MITLYQGMIPPRASSDPRSTRMRMCLRLLSDIQVVISTDDPSLYIVYLFIAKFATTYVSMVRHPRSRFFFFERR